MSTLSESSLVLSPLIHKMELADHGYQSLTRAQSLGDLAQRFEKLLRQIFEHSRIRAAYRPSGEALWTSTPMSDPLPAYQQPAETSSTDLEENGCLLHALRVFPDGSAVWIAIAPDEPGLRFTETDSVPLRQACTVLEAAYQALLNRQHEKSLVFSLNQRILQLNSLIDTGIEVSKLSADIAPHQMALQRAAALTNASRGCVILSTGESVVERISFPEREGDQQSDGAHSIRAKFTFAGTTYVFELFDKESRSGPVAFDVTDQLLLDALARQVHASLENRYLHAQSLEKQRIEQDIALAAAIQQRILPVSLPAIPGYNAAGINIPSKSVGGDYYDCIPLPDGRFALVIADVAGKGIPAALLVSSLHAYLNAYLEGPLPLVDLTRRLNTSIHRASTDDKFITGFVGILTPETGALETVNAGHCTVYWRKADGTVNELSCGGIPFGMLGIDFPYQSETITLGHGDRLLLYTDGITEAHDTHSRLYDADGSLKNFFARQTPADALTFVSALIADVKAFTGSAPQADDITALYLMRDS